MFRPPHYDRPFEKAPPLFRSGVAGGTTLALRIGQLNSSVRRNFLYGCVLSVLLHSAAGYSLRNYLAWPEPDPIIGFEGGIRVIDIVPLAEAAQEQRRVSQSRKKSGALTAVEVDPSVERAPAQTPTQAEALVPTPQPQMPVFPAPPPVFEEPTEEPIRIELNEDWTLNPSSREAALSQKFQPIRVVVPEYPDLAFENDVQGLVRLEAEVGISGRVLDVHVLESPDGGLSLSASRAMLHWEFKPFMIHGRPQPFSIVVPFRFRIE